MMALNGASGFVGTALRLDLDKKGEAYRIIERERITDPHAYAGCGVVIHMAGLAHRGRASEAEYQHINCVLAIAAARAASQVGVRRFVYVSSSKAIADYAANETPISEKDPAHPSDAYGRSKRAAELALIDLHNSGEIEVVILRPALIVGHPPKANLRLLVRLAQSNLRQIGVWFFGAICARRSYTPLSLLTASLEVAARHATASGHVFHVVASEPLTVGDLLAHMVSADATSPSNNNNSNLGRQRDPLQKIIGWILHRWAPFKALRAMSRPLILDGSLLHNLLGIPQQSNLIHDLREIMTKSLRNS